MKKSHKAKLEELFLYTSGSPVNAMDDYLSKEISASIKRNNRDWTWFSTVALILIFFAVQMTRNTRADVMREAKIEVDKVQVRYQAEFDRVTDSLTQLIPISYGKN